MPAAAWWGRRKSPVTSPTAAGARRPCARARSGSRLLASHAPVGIFLSDPAGNCVFVNEQWCAMSGLALAEAQGDGWTRAVHPDDRERILGGWKEAVERGAPSATEFRFLRADGRVVWAPWQRRPGAHRRRLPGLHGQLRGYHRAQAGRAADGLPARPQRPVGRPHRSRAREGDGAGRRRGIPRRRPVLLLRDRS